MQKTQTVKSFHKDKNIRNNAFIQRSVKFPAHPFSSFIRSPSEEQLILLPADVPPPCESSPEVTKQRSVVVYSHKDKSLKGRDLYSFSCDR